jgi:hypothetical protein
MLITVQIVGSNSQPIEMDVSDIPQILQRLGNLNYRLVFDGKLLPSHGTLLQHHIETHSILYVLPPLKKDLLIREIILNKIREFSNLDTLYARQSSEGDALRELLDEVENSLVDTYSLSHSRDNDHSQFDS